MAHPDIPERRLRNVWHRQVFDHSRLTTTDGRQVQILFPGIPNEDEGPDFLRARIRIGGTLFCGDVEIHRRCSGWTSHKHHRDPHYNAVILHVVLTESARDSRPAQTSSGRLLPTLALLPLLSTPDLAHVSGAPEPTEPPMHTRTPCLLPTRGAGEPSIVPWLLDLGTRRIEQRVASLRERRLAQVQEQNVSPAAKAGEDNSWDQLLYEGTLEGLGYAKNRDSFLALARNLPLATLKQFGLDDTSTIMSLLFGAAGLLPPPRTLRDIQSRQFVQALHQRWSGLRPSLRIPLLTPADWRSFRLRPANFPTARIAAICPALPTLFPPRATERLLNLMTAPLPCRRRTQILTELFTAPPHGYWRNHFAFGTPSHGGAAIGQSRALEIIINTLIPLGILLSRETRTTAAEQTLFDFLGDLPSPSPYRITQNLSNDIPSIGPARAQALISQGMLQMEKSYCRSRRCSECVFGTGKGVTSSAAFSLQQGRGRCSVSNDSRESCGGE